MNRKLTIAVSMVFLLSAVGFGLFWLQYYWAMEESNKRTVKAKCREGINEEFFGTIEKVERYEYSNFMNKNFFELRIQTNDTTDRFRTYQFNLEEYRDVLEFATQGQIIKKIKGQDSFVLKTIQGQEKNFTIPDCRLIED